MDLKELLIFGLFRFFSLIVKMGVLTSKFFMCWTRNWKSYTYYCRFDRMNKQNVLPTDTFIICIGSWKVLLNLFVISWYRVFTARNTVSNVQIHGLQIRMTCSMQSIPRLQSNNYSLQGEAFDPGDESFWFLRNEKRQGIIFMI